MTGACIATACSMSARIALSSATTDYPNAASELRRHV